MLYNTTIDTKSQYKAIETIRDYLIESVYDLWIVETARHLGFQFINQGFHIAKDGTWIPDPILRGKSTPLTTAQYLVYYALLSPDAYTEDSEIDIDWLWWTCSGIYSNPDIQDAIHWMLINGVMCKCEYKQIWGGLYDMSELIQQSNLYLQGIKLVDADEIGHDTRWIEDTIVELFLQLLEGGLA